MVLVHGRALLEQDERTVVIQADMRDTDGIFGHPETERLIDFSQPACVLFNSTFHCIPDSDTDGPLALARRVRERLAPGSFMVMCQLVSEDPEVRDFVTNFMDRATQGNWGRVREPTGGEGYFGGVEVPGPGLGEGPTWRPGPGGAPRQPTNGGVGFGGGGPLPPRSRAGRPRPPPRTARRPSPGPRGRAKG